MKYSVALARAKEFSIERNEPVMIAKAKRNNDCVILFEGETPTKNYEIIETVEITNNFECVLQEDDICNSVIKTECRGIVSKNNKKTEDGYRYIGKNRTETPYDYMAVQLTRHSAKEYCVVLRKDGCEYFIVEK